MQVKETIKLMLITKQVMQVMQVMQIMQVKIY